MIQARILKFPNQLDRPPKASHPSAPNPSPAYLFVFACVLIPILDVSPKYTGTEPRIGVHWFYGWKAYFANVMYAKSVVSFSASTAIGTIET